MMRVSFPMLLLLVMAALASWQAADGQTEEFQVRIYGFEEGLSHRNVYKVLQDTNGFIWIATVNGLNKFDGYEFTFFGKEEQGTALFESVITEMELSRTGQLWLVHPNFLTSFDPLDAEVSHLQINTQNLSRGEEQTPSNLAVGPDASIWMATYFERTGESYLQHWSASGTRLLNMRLPGKYENHPILLSDSLVEVAGFENELWLMQPDGEIVDRYSFPFRGDDRSQARVVGLQGLSGGRIYALLANGELYVQTGPAAAFERVSLPPFPQTGETFQSFLVEENGDVWFCGDDQLWYYHAASGELHDFNREVREITKHQTTYRQVFKDQAGVIWVASNFGIIKIVRSRRLFSTYLSGGNSYCSSGFCSMRGIAEDPAGNLYFSYYNSIHQLDRTTGELRPLFRQNDFVHAPFGLAYYRQALITGNGLRIDLKTLQVDTLFHDRLEDSGMPMVDRDGRLWIGFRKHLYRLRENEQQATRYRDAEGRLDTFPYHITYLHHGQRSGYLWIGTIENGVYRLDLQQNRLTHFPDDPAKLSHKRILAIFEDGQGHLWLATPAGLNRIDLVTGAYRWYTTEDGLANNFVNGILPEGDTALWISTDNGLSRLDLRENSFANFSKRDGLPANEFNRISFHQGSDGRLYFGGLNGIVAFQPGPQYVEQKAKRQGKLLFTSFAKYDGGRDSLVQLTTGLDPGKEIRLTYKDRFFTFGFSLADFANPRGNMYSYKLEGYELDWSPPTTINSARYNNIPAGRYLFRVRATAPDNDWNSEVLSVPVVIEQAYYKSRWFILLCCLAVIGLIYGFMRYRIYHIHRRQKELEEQVRLRTLELEFEKQKSDDLLLNILPAETAEELKTNGAAKAKRYEQVTVMFSDFKGFSQIAEQLEPEELVAEIDHCFRAYDQIIEQYSLEKIKTIGDAYLCVGGLLGDPREAAVEVVRAAIDIHLFMEELARERSLEGLPFFRTRIGIHTGPVVAGIVGIKKFAYDIWGDTVNIASRMESNAEVGKDHISQNTFQLVQDQFQCHYRGKVKAKNKGQIDMYYVERGALDSRS